MTQTDNDSCWHRISRFTPLTLRITLSILSPLLCVSPLWAQWTSVGNGIDYQKFTTTGPNNVFVARMAVSNTNCIIGSMIASNRVAGARETVSSQAIRYEDALNYWGQAWGQRNDVVVAINGSFFNGTSGIITGGHIYDGWYAKRFDDWSGQMGFVWKLDRSYFIGVCPHVLANEQTVTMGGATRNFDGINIARGANQLILYTPQYNNNTLTDSTGVEVLVEMPRPLVILSPPYTVTGTIREVRPNQGSTRIPFDHLVLSGVGTAATFLQAYAQVGQTIAISQNLRLYDGPSGNLCSTPDSRTFVKAYALTQGNFNFLKNGVIQPTTDAGMTNRNPRTAVAYNASYIYFWVCDGRSTQSVGMTSDEMGAFCLNTLGATDAVNMDGGGSSAMWVNGAIKNNPSDGVERTVANGLMMVNIQPKIVSTAYSAGQNVVATSTANVRLGPGTDNYAFTTVPNGAQGTVASHSLNGVYAKGYYWWKCTFGGAIGWIAENLLAGSNSPPSIIQQPTSQRIMPGDAASFAVTAGGSNPLSYQWQKNAVNQNDGGHYSGCTTGTLTISNVDSNDAASFRCVVTNAYGSVTSSPATLTLYTNIFGVVTLTRIPLLPGDTTSDARAVTPDGRWVAGISGSRGFLYAVGTTNVFNVISSDDAQSTLVTGVGYRTNGGQQQIIVSGLSGGVPTVWMTADGGVTWGAKLQYTDSTPKKPTVPAANGLAGTTSNVCYSIWTDEGTGGSDNWGLYVGRFSNSWPATVAWGSKAAPKPDTLQLNGVSSNGRGVGWRQNGSNLVYANYVADWRGATTPAVWNYYGLDGTTAGQAFSISADGTVIFGMSPKGVATGSTNYGYKAAFNTTFPGAATELSTNELPSFLDTAGSTTLAIPYGCTPDGKYAVGMNYRGAGTAVLWDASDPDPEKWTVLDLMKYAAAQGVGGSFTSLSCAYSAGFDAAGDVVIVGTGISGGATRAFLMTVPTPIRTPMVFSGSYPAGLIFAFLSLGSTVLTNYLEYTTNLSLPHTWNAVAATQCTGNIAVLSDPNPPDVQRFYRIRVQ